METTFHTIQEQGTNVATARMVTVSAEALEHWPCHKHHPFAQQGDLYFFKLHALPKDAAREVSPSGQLAPGMTQGSRHCVDLSTVTLYRLTNGDVLDGPLIDAPEGVLITHPEHGHLVFPPGVYGVTFQRAYADADDLRRVAD